MGDPFAMYRPDLYYSGIWAVDFSAMAKRGIENYIVDVDCTLAERDSQEIDFKVRSALMTAISAGYIKKACLVSNIIFGKKREERVAQMARSLDIPYVAARFFDRKPKPAPFLKALELMGSKKENTAVIGDQIFTDIIGARRLNMFAVLVQPLGAPHWITTLLLRRWREANLIKRMDLVPSDKDR